MLYFRSNLKYFRKLNKLSQKQLAEKVDVQATTISNWELGNSTPNIYQVAKLCIALGVGLELLVYGEVE